MRIQMLGLAVLGLLTVGMPSADAMDGKNGYAETLLFTEADVAGLPEFTGVDVLGTPTDLVSWLGTWPGQIAGDDLAVDAAGRVYALAIGQDVSGGAIPPGGTYGYKLHRSAILRWTPPATTGSPGTLETLYFEDRTWDPVSSTYAGAEITHILVAPAALGTDVAKDDLLIVRDGESVYALDPDDSGDTGTLIASVDLSGWYAHWTASPTTGRIYCLGDGQNPTNGTTPIHEISWNGSEYGVAAITLASVGGQDLIAGPDGNLYTLMPAWLTPDQNVVLRVDPSSGADSRYATIKVATSNSPGNFFGWAFDSTGRFWCAGVLRTQRKSTIASYLSPIVSGSQTTESGSIATFGATYLASWAMAGGPNGMLCVGERASSGAGVFALVPTSGSGGGGGGGKGKGK